MNYYFRLQPREKELTNRTLVIVYESDPNPPEAILIYTVSYTLYVIIGKNGVYREVRNSFFQILYRLKLKPLTLDRIGYFTQLCEYQVGRQLAPQ